MVMLAAALLRALELELGLVVGTGRSQGSARGVSLSSFIEVGLTRGTVYAAARWAWHVTSLIFS